MTLRRNTNEMHYLLQQAAVSCQYSRYFFFFICFLWRLCRTFAVEW